MKKIPTIVFILIGIILGFTVSALTPNIPNKANTANEDTYVPPLSKTYTREMVITEINTTEDTVILVDTEGHEWAFYGVENWCVGDECICTMDNKGTENITDDVIIFTTYNGN